LDVAEEEGGSEPASSPKVTCVTPESSSTIEPESCVTVTPEPSVAVTPDVADCAVTHDSASRVVDDEDEVDFDGWIDILRRRSTKSAVVGFLKRLVDLTLEME
jgi:hypothetical protein